VQNQKNTLLPNEVFVWLTQAQEHKVQNKYLLQNIIENGCYHAIVVRE